MATSRTYVILNSSAGSVDESASFTTKLREHLPEARVLFPKAAGEATVLAQQAVRSGCDLLVCAGGDGTLNEVVHGLDGHFSETRVGLLPMGTANDFARSIGMPNTLDEALELICRGQSAAIDVIRVNTSHVHHMINVSAGGFGASVDEKMTGEMKDRWGSFCYARSFVAALSDLSDYETEIILDDSECLRTPAYNIVIANGRYVAGGIPVAPTARLDDGLMDLIVIPVASLPQLALLTSATLLGKHLDSDQLLFRRARKIQIRSEPPMRFNTDGELIGHSPATFEVLPGAIEFIVGNPESTAAGEVPAISPRPTRGA